MPSAIDTDTKDLLQRLDERLKEISPIKDAVKQLENQVAAWPGQLEKKLAAVRSVSWDRNGQYRGVFSTEDDARCFGLYVMAKAGNDARAADILAGEMKSVFERAQGSNPSSAGGGLVPIEYSARVNRLVEAFGVFPANAFPMPMSSDKMTYQRRTSGLTVFKTGENTAATASEMGFETINLNADEWNVLSLYPKSLAEDSAADIGELVALEIAQAFAEQIDASGFIGDGTPTYLDVMGITTRLTQINGVDDGGGLVLGSGAAGTGWGGLVADNFSQLIGQLPTYRGIAPKFYVSNPFFWTVMNPLTLAAGGVSRGEHAGEQSLMYNGFKVEIVQQMPKVTGNSQVCALFGDLRLAADHGTRKDLMVETSNDVKFIERQTAVLGTQRHAISVHSLGDDTNAGAMVGMVTQVAA